MTVSRPVSVPAWRWAWTQTRRDLRAGSMRLLLLAVALAVAALTAVAFFADRIERGLARDAAQLLGADVVVLADQPVPSALIRRAEELGLRTSQTIVMSSMARAPDEQGGEARLVAIKAVTDGYPLRGRVTLLDDDGREASAWRQAPPTREAPAGGPAQGEVWVDHAVLTALNLAQGDTLWLGEASFRIAAVIVTESDRGGGFVNFAPRVMMHLGDLGATELIQPASRLTYRLLVAHPDADRAQGEGSRGPLATFTAEAEKVAEEGRGVRVETLEQGRPEMRTTLDRAGLFLRLVALLAALLSAVAVAVVARDFAQQRLNDCALMRVMGVAQRTMAWTYGLQFLLVGALASLVGIALGWACHLVFVALLANLVQVDLPAAGWMPWGLGLGVGVLLTLGFGLPPVLQLARVPPLRVLRRDLGAPKWWSAGVALLGGGALIGLLLLVAHDIRLGSIALGGFAGAVLVFALTGWAAVRALDAVARHLPATLPPWWRLGTRQLTAQTGVTVLQVCALGVGLLALMLLVLIRTDLVDNWQSATPPDAPNRFVINIQPDQVDDFQRALKEAGVDQYDWYPMARGRLVGINGRPVSSSDYTEDRARRLVDREFNLSYAAESPPHNPVVAGRYADGGEHGFSVESGIAQTLGLKLGDTLQFDFAGLPHEGRITSLRHVDWSSMRVNFFVMGAAAEMPNWPITYITAFQAPEDGSLDRTMAQRFPNVTVVDVSATLRQVQSVLTQVISAVEFLFVFTLSAGLIVLMAGLMTSRERRAREWAILRSLGATRELMARVQRFELLGVGALAGFLAALAAIAIGWALSTQVFDFRWQLPWAWPLYGAIAGALLSGLGGWWSLRGVTRRPVVLTLRQTD